MTDARGAEALRRHAESRGKVQMAPKCAIAGPQDFAIWYTPGVAEPCRAIRAEPQRVFELTNRGNTIAIVSDGSRVLGLGDIGPEAGLPVMEGKALLFKVLGGVDAVPLCLGTHDVDELVAVVRALEPSFGGINLEDIAQPGCFRALDALRGSLSIPVWHDDQQGTATAVFAGLTNALSLTGRALARTRIALVGMGAANVAVYRLLKACGADPGAIVACDSRGALHRGRADVEAARERYPDKWAACSESNADGVSGGIADAMRGADVCIAFSRPEPGLIRPEWVRGMAREAIVFACANPAPEIWPDDAHAAGARIVATGRSDFPNQINNSLVFPGVFRGTLDAGARAITDAMALAAGRELARCGRERGLREEALLPSMADWETVPHIAAATALQAQADGVARRQASREDYLREATQRIRSARSMALAINAACAAP
jgi:malate dehydrogenase (oxaloacetate-decarboxylating)